MAESLPFSLFVFHLNEKTTKPILGLGKGEISILHPAKL
jgi:hypothetical protein